MSAPYDYRVEITTALATLRTGGDLERGVLRRVVRETLAVLARRAPGRSVEVRVPPYGAIQCVEGPRHGRGTPPNVVETDPVTWLEIASGRLGWHEAVRAGRIKVSGIRADLSDHLPIFGSDSESGPSDGKH